MRRIAVFLVIVKMATSMMNKKRTERRHILPGGGAANQPLSENSARVTLTCLRHDNPSPCENVADIGRMRSSSALHMLRFSAGCRGLNVTQT